MLLEAMNGLEIATLTELDAVVQRLYSDRQTVSEMRMGVDAVVHFAHLAEAADAVVQVTSRHEHGEVVGLRVTGYVHPSTGEIIKITPLTSDRERVEFHALAA